MEGHPDCDLKENWKYYLEEAQQEPEVQAKLSEIRKEYAALNPEDIKLIDRTLGLDLIDAHRLKLEISHRTGRILRERLVDPEADLLPHDHLAVYQMRL